MKDEPFSFNFDETTTGQVKKQYDGYVPNFGHCTSDDLVQNDLEFGEQFKWNVKYLVQIGMDGPNENLKFHRLLEEELLKTYNKKIINIGTCSLHPVHNALCKGIKLLNFDFDRLAQDLHFFF